MQELTPELLARHGITPDKFEPAVWEQGQFEGRQYAIPLDTHPFVLYYNTDLAKKADLLGDDGQLRPLSGEQRGARRVRGLQGGLGPVGRRRRRSAASACGGSSSRSTGSRAAGPCSRSNGTELTLDQDKGLRALEFMQELGVRAAS